MMTLAQDAARLREMADETAEIAKRLLPYIPQGAQREHPAINAHASTGGACGALRRSAGWHDLLIRELNK